MKKIFAYAAAAAVLCSCGKAPFRDVLQKYSEDPQVKQLVLVRHVDGSNAWVTLVTRQDGKRWRTVETGKAYVGRNGVGKEREGDGKTPLGEFGIRHAFGILPNPGTSIEYLQVTPTTFGCDEQCEYYNTIIDTAAVHHDCKGEDMSNMAPAYNYGIFIDYNPGNEWPLGSLIFLHGKGRGQNTSGCVAVDEAFMKKILQCCGPEMRICIR